jgi:uncharacterized protein YcbK (DUF882 family)
MGDISPNFNRSEFACKCGCDFSNINPELVVQLEKLRSHFNAIVLINCGCRCEKHNEAVGGKPHSQHLSGNAADIRVKGYSPALVADWLEFCYPDNCGIGRYTSFTHFDVRPDKARWRG